MGLLHLRLTYNYTSSSSIHSPHFFINSPIKLSSSQAGGREGTFNSERIPSLSTVYEEVETSHKCFQRVFTCFSSASGILDNDSLERQEIKVNKGKRSPSSVHEVIDDTRMPFGEEISTASMKYQTFRAMHFRLLLENLGTLEETFADSEAQKLRDDIMLQLGKLGALEFFEVCLSRAIEPSRVLDFANGHPNQFGEQRKNSRVDEYMDKVVVHSSRKKQNRTRRKRAFTATEILSRSLPLKADQEELLCVQTSSVRRESNGKNRRIVVARREAEMSKAVKVLAELEKISAAIEDDTKQAASLSNWAEAAGVDEQVLKQKLLYGQYCRDELIRSTRPLVLYIARKYKGMGIAMEDLLQAGYVGVLQGAERFDCTRGYRFSTYVQYWIRKSMSRMVTRYARSIVVPWSLSKAINQIQKAQKSLKNACMKCPDDYEIAKMTGLSLDKIRSASNCLRVVASIDQKVWDCYSIKYMEFMPDTAVGSPEEAVMKQHMRKDIYDLLNCLDSRERQILILRFGLIDHQPRSLEDIGRLFKVSKEWIRRLVKNALSKLRDKSSVSNLNVYLGLDF
ncbi:putative RNA polymerase sigma-K type, RNA polymerase sigma-70 like domain-containing protein [Lupinus albus]|uniref:Putative RNA polymerase sigma-K type, RNA polymerase sigma-70 like domain-containing protein n=1 Tax=Lupinus albus TaxID=3870 RepID=A0A6A4PQ67_LUPAL|nr:putative RNA polymerase sigma-K type, RNA polymerase sigma-70 like domain-containing protein [Lupinus albus]